MPEAHQSNGHQESTHTTPLTKENLARHDEKQAQVGILAQTRRQHQESLIEAGKTLGISLSDSVYKGAVDGGYGLSPMDRVKLD